MTIETPHPKHAGAAPAVAIVNLGYDPQCTTTRQLLELYFSLTGFAQGLQQAGAAVAVFQRFATDDVHKCSGITYHCVADGQAPLLRPWQLSHRLDGQVAQWCAAQIARGHPTVVHLNGLLFPLPAWHLRRLLPDACALVVQHHAERPWRSWRHLVQRWGLRAVDGFLFTNRELAQPWLARRIIPTPTQVHELMECSSLLVAQEQDAARQTTGMGGKPVVLWTGNLDSNKDPLTVLAGFARLLEHWPTARLYMTYRGAHLLPQIEAVLAQDTRLCGAVILLGSIPYAQMGAYYSSADYFVQGSAHEGSGIALLDAMACGAVPVVTDIPSFRTITQQGAVGTLWPVGDAEAFAVALLAALARPRVVEAQRGQALFQEKWSFDAIGLRAVAIYQEILRQRPY